MCLRMVFRTKVGVVVFATALIVVVDKTVVPYVARGGIVRHLSILEAPEDRGGAVSTDVSVPTSRPLKDDDEKNWSLGQNSPLKPRFERTGVQMSRPEPKIHLVAVACGDRASETLTMLKSAAALTTGALLVFHIFAEKKLQEQFSKELQAWPGRYSERMAFRVYDVTIPPAQNATWWTTIFWRPCAYQRLFLHSLLTDVDAALYVDTDTLFLGSPLPVWLTLTLFSPSQLVGMAANHEDPAGGGWYRTDARTPYVSPSGEWQGSPSGVNSGVILMNLTRLRASNWSECIERYSHVYRSELKLVDQDIINIYLHHHPDQLFRLDCALNYRTDHCTLRYRDPNSACPSAETQGIHILHGNRRAFNDYRALRNVYEAFNQFKLGESLHTGLLRKLRGNLRKITTACSTVTQAFVIRLTATVNGIEPV
ncbi:hypothetical protein ACOMHN_060952 [Nucella lapillus]